MTEDTYIGNKTDVLSINRYNYGSGNPLKYKDPDGNYSLIIQAGIDSNIGVGGGTSIGVAFGWNTQTGLEIKVVGSGALSATSSVGGAVTGSFGIDWTDTPIGQSTSRSVGGSISPAVFVLGGDMNFDSMTGKPTGISVQGGLSASLSPFTAVVPIFGKVSVEGHVKQTWSNELFDVLALITNTYSSAIKYVKEMINTAIINDNRINCR